MLLVAFALGIPCQYATAQSINLTGKVLEENGDPINGATVRFQGSKGGVVTKEDGTFTIKSPLKGTLIISAVGHADKTVDVTGHTAVTISLTKTNR